MVTGGSLGRLFCGLDPPPGALPIAQAYAGHQFGYFTMLGDGRALLLGEHLTPTGQRVDIHLKGSGPTAFSRRGDGKAALAPMLREYIISEGLHALGIPCTRTLAVALTGETIYRQSEEPGAVMTRTAASHLRVGTFEYAAAFGKRFGLPNAVNLLADYALQRHDSDLASLPAPERYITFFSRIVSRQAALVARWMHVGFIHGVMNTDNTSIAGESIDFGPCAFLDEFDANAVFSSIDHDGRYAYGNQPKILHWNLERLADAMAPLWDDDASCIAPVLGQFQTLYRQHWLAGARAKLGLTGPFAVDDDADDTALFEEFLSHLQAGRSDYTNAFRLLPTAVSLRGDVWPKAWHTKWMQRLRREGTDIHNAEHTRLLALRLEAANPLYIPRNHLVQKVLSEVTASGGEDLTSLTALLARIRSPFQSLAKVRGEPGGDGDRGEDRDFDSPYTSPPSAAEKVTATFCGT